MSAMGYLAVMSGSYGLGLFFLSLFAALSVLLLWRFRNSFVGAIVALVIARFVLGGSLFNVYYGLTLVLVLLIARGLVRADLWLARRLGYAKVIRP